MAALGLDASNLRKLTSMSAFLPVFSKSSSRGSLSDATQLSMKARNSGKECIVGLPTQALQRRHKDESRRTGDYWKED